MPNRRVSRVNDLLREELSELLRRDLRDPRVADMTSITHVEVSPDLHLAKVYVSIMGTSAQKQESLAILTAATSFLHRGLRARLTFKHIPTLSFYLDDSIEEGARLFALMQELRNQSPGQ